MTDTRTDTRTELALDDPLPRRPRRQWLSWRSAILTAIATCAIGFYAGVRVEKGQVSGSGRTISFGGTGTASAGTGARARAAAGGFFGAPGAAGGAAGAGGSAGTVQSVDGRTLVLRETSGNSVAVRLTSQTKVTKSESVSHGAVRPGDTIVVTGASGRSGTLVAARVTDSGASSTGSTSGSSSGSVGALFSSGAGG